MPAIPESSPSSFADGCRHGRITCLRALAGVIVVFVTSGGHIRAGDPAVPSPQKMQPAELLSYLNEISSSAEIDEHEDRRRCGVYSLTFLLTIRGTQQSPERIHEVIPVGPAGTSLLELKTAARQLGRPLEVFKCSPRKLESMPLPAIAHLEPSDVAPEAHYVVLLNISPTTVTLFDWNGRGVNEYDRKHFERRCSGYFLAEPVSMPMESRFSIGLSCMNLALIAFLWRTRQGSSPRSPGDAQARAALTSDSTP